MCDLIKDMEIEIVRANEMIDLISKIGQYDELPLFITRPGITRALEIPYNERKNLIRFCLVVWETEKKRLEYFLNKYKAMERGNFESGN